MDRPEGRGLRQGIHEVVVHSIAVRQICVIRMKKMNQAHVWQALHSMVGFHPATGKIVIAVDEEYRRNRGSRGRH